MRFDYNTTQRATTQTIQKKTHTRIKRTTQEQVRNKWNKIDTKKNETHTRCPRALTLPTLPILRLKLNVMCTLHNRIPSMRTRKRNNGLTVSDFWEAIGLKSRFFPRTKRRIGGHSC